MTKAEMEKKLDDLFTSGPQLNIWTLKSLLREIISRLPDDPPAKDPVWKY